MTRHLTQSSLFRFIYIHLYIVIHRDVYDVEKFNWAGEEKSNERWIAPLSNFKYTCILWYVHNNRDKEINIALYPSTSFISLTTIQPCRHVSLILFLSFLLFSWRVALKYFSHSILHTFVFVLCGSLYDYCECSEDNWLWLCSTRKKGQRTFVL